jgi:hypothetical protein
MGSVNLSVIRECTQNVQDLSHFVVGQSEDEYDEAVAIHAWLESCEERVDAQEFRYHGWCGDYDGEREQLEDMNWPL